MSTGAKCIELARKHLGEKYVLGAFIPKDLKETEGPWDCAELISWCIFQAGGILYGVDDHLQPARADAYTGYFKSDALEMGHIITLEEAASIQGAIVLRYPQNGLTGHIVFSKGNGRTLEAKGAKEGVVEDTLAGRRWDIGILVPGMYYDQPAPIEAALVAAPKPGHVYYHEARQMKAAKVKEIQKALTKAGFNSGGVDGIYGAKTAAAVHNFQIAKGLVPDGEVGKLTARALGVAWV